MHPSAPSFMWEARGAAETREYEFHFNLLFNALIMIMTFALTLKFMWFKFSAFFSFLVCFFSTHWGCERVWDAVPMSNKWCIMLMMVMGITGACGMHTHGHSLCEYTLSVILDGYAAAIALSRWEGFIFWSSIVSRSATVFCFLMTWESPVFSIKQ